MCVLWGGMTVIPVAGITKKLSAIDGGPLHKEHRNVWYDYLTKVAVV